MANYKQALFNNPYVRIPFGSITGTYTNIDIITNWQPGSTQSGSAGIIMIQNNLNQDVILSFDGGVTDSFYLLTATTGLVIDLATNGMLFEGTVQIKHTGAAPTSGAIVFNTIGVKI